MVKKAKKTPLLLLLSVISAILYRLGGWGKPFKSWMRDWLIPIVFTLALLLFWLPPVWYGWLLLLVSFGLLGASLTTYYDSLFGFDNFWFHGFMCGFAAFPLCFVGISWIWMLVRAVVLAVFMGGLNWWVHKYKIPKSDWIEELSRGFVITITVPLLII